MNGKNFNAIAIKQLYRDATVATVIALRNLINSGATPLDASKLVVRAFARCAWSAMETERRESGARPNWHVFRKIVTEQVRPDAPIVPSGAENPLQTALDELLTAQAEEQTDRLTPAINYLREMINAQ